MSDSKDDNQNDKEFEPMFSSSDEVVDVVVEDVEEDEEKSSGDDAYDVSDDYEAASSPADFSDIDDGMDMDDDEEGIFAVPPEPRRTKKSGSSFGVLLLTATALAAVGAGGYLYLNNPDLVSQIKNNFMGGGSDDSASAPSFELSGILPSPEPEKDVNGSGEEIAQVPAPDSFSAEDMPPQPESISNQPVSNDEVMVENTDPPAEDAVVENTVAPEETPAALGAATTEPEPSPEPVSEKPVVQEDQVAQVEPPAAVEAPAEEKVPESVTSPQDITPEPQQPAAEAEKPVEVPVVPDVAKTEVPDVKLVKDEPSDKTPDEKGLSEAPKPVSSKIAEVTPEEKKASEESVYYDSPSGKILSDLPAPALNPSKGKSESIIIVNTPKKSTAVSKTASKAPKSVVIESNSLDSQIIAAGRAMKLGRYDAATEMYEDLYHLNPRDPRILMGRAVCFQKTGQADLAISTYEELLRVDPQNTDAIVNLSGLVRKAHPAEALAKLLDLRKTYPENPAVAAQLGVAYADSGNLEDAFRYLSFAASIEPDNPLHYYNMAIVSEMARDLPKAISYYEKALEVDAVHGSGREIPRDMIYDRLTRLRGN